MLLGTTLFPTPNWRWNAHQIWVPLKGFSLTNYKLKSFKRQWEVSIMSCFTLRFWGSSPSGHFTGSDLIRLSSRTGSLTFKYFWRGVINYYASVLLLLSYFAVVKEHLRPKKGLFILWPRSLAVLYPNQPLCQTCHVESSPNTWKSPKQWFSR